MKDANPGAMSLSEVSSAYRRSVWLTDVPLFFGSATLFKYRQSKIDSLPLVMESQCQTHMIGFSLELPSKICSDEHC